jgi:hypothetical protein
MPNEPARVKGSLTSELGAGARDFTAADYTFPWPLRV